MPTLKSGQSDLSAVFSGGCSLEFPLTWSCTSVTHAVFLKLKAASRMMTDREVPM